MTCFNFLARIKTPTKVQSFILLNFIFQPNDMCKICTFPFFLHSKLPHINHVLVSKIYNPFIQVRARAGVGVFSVHTCMILLRGVFLPLPDRSSTSSIRTVCLLFTRFSCAASDLLISRAF